MLIKFFPGGKGRGDNLIHYLVRERDSKGLIREPRPEVLSGDPELLRRIINSLKFNTKFQTGVISFAPEDKPTPSQQREVMESFERLAFPGLDRDQYDILWVRHSHTEENRTELHFLLPTVEFSTGKYMNVTYPGSHKTYYGCWQDYWNCKCKWADPHDPARRRDIQPGFHATIDRQIQRLDIAGLATAKRDDARMDIHAYIVEQIEAGIIHDRKSLKLTLEDCGFILNREGDNYISLTGNKLKQPIRFKGRIYERGWTAEGDISRITEAEGNRTEGATTADSQRRIRQLQDELESRIASRSRRFTERYSSNKKEFAFQNTPTIREDNQDKPNSFRAFISGQFGDDVLLSSSGEQLDSTSENIDERVRVNSGTGTNIIRDLEEIQRRLRSGKEAEEGIYREMDTYSTQKRRATEERIGGIKGGITKFNERRERIIVELDECDTELRNKSGNFSSTLYRNREQLSKANECITTAFKEREELEQFKTAINLVSYAEFHRYQINQKKSTRNCVVMKGDRGDCILIGIDKNDGHYFYTSLSDPSDCGSIVDFVQKRSGVNLGGVRQELRPWLSGFKFVEQLLPKVFPATKDYFSILVRLIRYEDNVNEVPQHPYLIKRKIRPTVTGSDRFHGAIYQDESGNVIFPHGDGLNLTGYEIRNQDLKRFSKGGSKAVWRSHTRRSDTALVVCESPIDCLSYYQIKDSNKNYRYISTGGNISESQRAVIAEAFREMHILGGAIILATDNDDAGRRLAEELKALAPTSSCIIFDSPAPQYGKDWNDVLFSRANNRPSVQVQHQLEEPDEVDVAEFKLDDELEL